MKLHTLLMFGLMAAMLVCAGCNGNDEAEDDENGPPEPPPPKTQQQIYQELTQGFQALQAPPAPGNISQLQGQLQQAMNLNRAEQNYNVAVNQVRSQLENLYREHSRNERWALAKATLQMLKTLDPGHPNVDSWLEQVQEELNRPRPSVSGFFEDVERDETIAFIDVYFPATGRTEQVQVRPGEEFHGYRFMGVIGRQNGVRLEYLKNGEVYEIMAN